jgi:hypothetical protein
MANHVIAVVVYFVKAVCQRGIMNGSFLAGSQKRSKNLFLATESTAFLEKTLKISHVTPRETQISNFVK